MPEQEHLFIKTRAGRAFYLWLLVITVFGGGLRVYNLGSTSLLFDELFTVRDCARYGASPPLHRCKVLGYMPTSVALWAQGISPTTISAYEPDTWRSQGITETRIRLASVLIGIVTIPLLGIVSCGIIGARAACLMALLLAVAPWHIYWSQTGRFYAAQFLFYNLALIWYLTATRERSRVRMVGAMACMILAFLTQPPALVIVAIFAADWLLGLVLKRPVRLGVFGWTCAVVALALCYGSLQANISDAPEGWTQFAGDLYQSPARLILGTVYLVDPGVCIFAILSGWWLLSRERGLAAYLLLGALVPTLVFACVSLRNYVALRYMFVCLYAWLALAAIGADQLFQTLRPRVGRMLALAPLALLLIAMMLVDYSYFTSGGGFHPRWRDAFAYVSSHRKPAEAVATDPFIGRYYLEDADVQFAPENGEDLEAFDKPVWVVIRAQEPIRGRRFEWLDDLSELKAYFDLRVAQPYSSVRVYYYDPARRLE